MSIRTFMKKFLLIAVAVALVSTVPADSALSASVISVASTPSQEEIVEYAQNYPSDLVSYSDWGFPQNGYTIGFRINLSSACLMLRELCQTKSLSAPLTRLRPYDI